MKQIQFAIGLLLAGWLVVSAPAQVITGTILGAVLDSSGAAVPGAAVTITNTNTRVVTNTASNADGHFTVPYLQPGRYDVAIEAAGFRAFKEAGIELTLDAKVRVDAKLQVGNVTESIVVAANAVALQTDASDVNMDISEKTLENMPNLGKNPMAFAGLVAGIVGRAGWDDPDNLPLDEEGRRSFSAFTVNGSRSNASEILLDGAPNTSAAYNEIAVLPNTDALGQVKIITNAYSAEFGRAGGGVFSFGTKSGTNAFHGSLYEYWRNPVLNANTFGNNLFGLKADGSPVRPRGKFNLNQFGGTFHGPVEIPRFYSGRNRTFFFASFEGLRRVDDASAYYTVPTALERAGDFSQTRALVRNPATNTLVQVPRNIYAPFASTTTVTQTRPGVYRLNRQQFQDGAILNKIPKNMINPVAARIIETFPLPNLPGNQDGTQNFFNSDANRTATSQLIVKTDHNASQAHRTFFRYTNDWTQRTPANMFRTTNPDAGTTSQANQFNPTATIGHTWTQSVSSLWEFRANMTRLNLVQGPPSGLDGDLVAAGFSPEMAQMAPTQVFPRIETSGYPTMGLGSAQVRNNHSMNLAFTGNWTKILRKWTVKVGGEYRSLLNNYYTSNMPSLAFKVADMTYECVGSDCPSIPWDKPDSHRIADFLLGNMDGQLGNGQFSTGEPKLALKNTYMGFFSQNDWKATRRLTLNIGVRWDYQGPLNERYNRLTQFDRYAKNATGTPGRFLFAGTEGLGRGQTDPDYRNFAPRVGFAYRIGDKTVIRSAYGISYDQITGVGSGANGYGTAGFQSPAFMRIRPLSGLDILERPFNDAFSGGGTAIGPNPNSPDLLGLNGVIAYDRGVRTPYVQQWNFTVERRLPGVHVSLGYVGTKGTRLIVQSLWVNEINAVPESILESYRRDYIATGTNPAGTMVPNPFYKIIPTGNPTLGSPTIAQINLHKPMPAFSSIRYENHRWGSSSYNSMQLTARRPFKHGFEVSGTYTFSKNIDYGSSIGGGGAYAQFTVNDMSLERAVAANDVPHRATLNWIWELPFGRKGYLFRTTPVVRQVLGGWKASGVAMWQSGYPMAITGGTGFGRLDLIGDPVLPEEYRVIGDGKTAYPLPDGSTIVVPDRRLLYFNPKAFHNRVLETKNPRGAGAVTVGDIYWYGTAPRFDSRLRTPGVNNFNMALTRTFPIRESLRAELKVDGTNVFNRKEWSLASITRAFGSTNLQPSRGPVGYSTSANFGTLDVTAKPGRQPRVLRLSLRLSF